MCCFKTRIVVHLRVSLHLCPFVLFILFTDGVLFLCLLIIHRPMYDFRTFDVYPAGTFVRPDRGHAEGPPEGSRSGDGDDKRGHQHARGGRWGGSPSQVRRPSGKCGPTHCCISLFARLPRYRFRETVKVVMMATLPYVERICGRGVRHRRKSCGV